MGPQRRIAAAVQREEAAGAAGRARVRSSAARDSERERGARLGA